MKRLLILLVLLLAATISRAQIINGDFENWTTDSTIDYWQFNGEWSFGNATGFRNPGSHNGAYCAGVYIAGKSASDVLSVVVRSLTAKNSGFGYSKKDKFISYWYKLFVTSIIVMEQELFYKHGSTNVNQSFGMFVSPSDNWTRVRLPLEPASSDSTITDSVGIVFLYGGQQETRDFTLLFLLDDVTLDTETVSVASKNNITNLLSISPNPISSHANLRYTLSGTAPIHASLYDITGRKVLQLPWLDDASGSGLIPFDVDEIPDGVYYVRCEIGVNVMVRKIIVSH